MKDDPMPLTTAQIQRDGPLPRHFQVRKILTDLVATEQWRPGDKIPAETDIADALGVSKMTVNKAILALTAEGLFIREVGRGTFVAAPGRTRTMATARTLQTQRSRQAVMEEALGGERDVLDGVRSAAATLHVITVGPAEKVADNEYMCALLLAMRCRISPLEATLALRQARGDQYADFWREGGSDGWLLIAPRQEAVPGLHRLAEMKARAVIVGASWPGVALPFVDSDNHGGVETAVAHLTDLGHRKIALLYANPSACNTQHRVEGFRASLQARGLPDRADWRVDAGMMTGVIEPVAEHLRRWLRLPDRPTAFVAAGPFLACTLLEIAREVGLEAPRDLSIVGFDDPAALANAIPALTTVRQPLEEMGGEAVASLHRLAREPRSEEPPSRIVLPCRLLVRGSTAPPGGKSISGP